MNTVFRAVVIALLIAVVVASGAAAGGCSAGFNSQSVRGSGVVATEPRDATGFNDVLLSGSGEVVVEQTGAESVAVEAEDNILPLLETSVKNGVLRLGVKEGVSIHTTKPIRYRITAKSLSAIGLSGSGSLRARGVNAERFAVQISGSGSADLEGRADNVELRISGSGACNAESLSAETFRVIVSGSGDATVNASDRIDATISGSGTIRYLGDPRISQQVSGSGRIVRR
jgi:hypothetical protein